MRMSGSTRRSAEPGAIVPMDRVASAPRRSRGPAGRALPGVAALLLAALLGGCASAPRSGGYSGVPVNVGSGCHAPEPNLRAAYNRPYTVKGRSYVPLRSAQGYDAEGTASWYGWESGSTTAMGTRFTPREFTAASRVLPLPTCVQVTNLDNGRSALVLVNDRGPFVDTRLLDLSYGAAMALGVTATGTAPVRIVALPDGANAPLQVAAATSASPPPAPMPVSLPAPELPAAAQPQRFAPTSAPTGAVPVEPGPTATDSTPMVVQTLAPIAAASDPATAPPIAASAPSTVASQPGVDQGSLPQPALQLASSATTPPAGASAASTPPAMVAPTLPGAAESYVQTGAFTVEANARAERARLQAAGIGNVLIVPGYIAGRTYYRVQIGPLDGATPDTALQGRLQALGLRNYAVVQQ